jgi:hypothetical protein
MSPVNVETTPVNAGMTPVIVGMAPVNMGATPFIVGMTPVNVGVIPFNVGTTPVNVGTIPLNLGATPLNEGTIPVNAGTIPLNVGMINFFKNITKNNDETLYIDLVSRKLKTLLVFLYKRLLKQKSRNFKERNFIFLKLPYKNKKYLNSFLKKARKK